MSRAESFLIAFGFPVAFAIAGLVVIRCAGRWVDAALKRTKRAA